VGGGGGEKVSRGQRSGSIGETQIIGMRKASLCLEETKRVKIGGILNTKRLATCITQAKKHLVLIIVNGFFRKRG